MKKNILHSITILFLFMVTINIYGQNLNIEYSELQITSRTSSICGAGNIDKYIFIVKKEDYLARKMSINIYRSDNMELLSSKIIKEPSCSGNTNCIDKQFTYEHTLFMKNSIMILFSTYNKKANELLLFAQKINKKGEFDGKLKLIDKIKAEKRNNLGSFEFTMTEDSSKFLILQHPPYEKSNEEYKFKIYDESLNNLNNLSQHINIKDKNISVSKVILSNNKEIILLCEVSVEKKEKEKGKALKYYMIYTIKPDTNNMSEYRIDLPNKDIESVAIKIDNDQNHLFCTGLYSEIEGKKHSGRDIDGFFFLKIDPHTTEIISKSYKRLESSLVQNINETDNNSKKKKKSKKNANRGISENYEIQNIITKQDGSILVINENKYNYTVTRTTCDSKGNCHTTSTEHYIRANILAMNITPEGEIEWFVNIPKYQHSVNDLGRYSSFGLINKEDKVIIIYNDNPENISENVKTLKATQGMYNIRKACLVEVEIKNDGSYSKRLIFNNLEKEIIAIPESIIKMENGESIVPTLKLPKPMTCACFAMFSKTYSGIMKLTLKK